MSSPTTDTTKRINISTTTKDPEEEPIPKSKPAILRIHGPDQKGIVAAFSQLLYGHGCGIINAEQFTDSDANLFFQRIVFDYSTMHTDRTAIAFGVKEVCERFHMTFSLNWNDARKKIAIMVSKYDHCLWELLLRHRADELDCDIVAIISNHDDLHPVAEMFGIPYHVFKVTKATKVQVEEEELQLLKEIHDVDLVILARYMQIISDNFCNAFDHKVINIHHSFLPAFIGGRPYHRAHERYVCLMFCLFDVLLV
jgi:formyltetrahydrofolate deformylase